MSLDSLSAPQQKLLETVASAIGPCYYPLPPSAPPPGETAVLLPGDSAPDLAERARQRRQRRELQGQYNLERIIELAVQAMPEKASANGVEAAWLNTFFAYAENADDALRQGIWARLLAAETAEPHSVASRALGIFAHMDDWEIEGFATCCAFSFAFESGWRFMIEDELAEKEIINYLQGNDMTQHCIELGLLCAEKDGMRCLSSRGMRIRYREKCYELAKPAPEKADAVLAYRRYTQIGQQLAQALQPKKFYGFARNVLQSLEKLRGIRLEAIEEADAGQR